MNISRSRLRLLVPLVLLMVVSIVALAVYSDKGFQSDEAKGTKTAPAKSMKPAVSEVQDSAPSEEQQTTPQASEQKNDSGMDSTEEPVNRNTTHSQGGSSTLDLPDTDSISFIKSLMALSFVLGLIFLAAYFFKKVTGMKGTGSRTNRVPIHMVGHMPLGEKKFLSIVEIQGKHYFIGITPTNINMLSQLELEIPEDQLQPDGDGDFENIFEKARTLLQKGKK